ncbi:MAG: FtsX-like permease family protein [Gemmatimonadota bacterium]
MPASLATALRSLRRSPVYTTVAVASLACSLGVAAAVAAIVNSIRNPTVPFEAPHNLFWVTPIGDGASRNVPARARLEAMRQMAGAIDQIATHRARYSLVQLGKVVEEGPIRAVSPNYFELLGVRAARGFLFSSARTADAGGEDRAGAVISHSLWQRAIAGGAITGQAISVGGRIHPIIGVAPPGLNWGGDNALAWTVMPADLDARDAVAGIVRVQDGVTRTQLGDQLRRTASSLAGSHGQGRVPFRFLMFDARPEPELLDDVHYALIAGAIAILLIACANLAALVLARGLSRQGEVAVRLALGARRSTVALTVLSECVIVAAAGLALGAVMASWGIDIVQRYLPPRVPYLGELTARFDPALIALLAGAALILALLAGLWPSLRLTRAGSALSLGAAGPGVTRSTRGAFRWLVVTEVTMALTVLVCAGLLTRAAHNMARIDVAYDADRIVAGWIGPRRIRGDSAIDLRSLISSLVSRAAALPGAEGAAWESGFGGGTVTAAIPGGGNRLMPGVSGLVVSDNYFATMGIPILQGRPLERGDGAAGAAVIDELSVNRLFPGENPLGQLVSLDATKATARWVRIVGVAKTIRPYVSLQDPFSKGSARVYLASDSLPAYRSVLVRAGDGQLPVVAAGFAALVNDMTPSGMSGGLDYVNSSRENTVRGQAFVAAVFLALAGLALLLCAVGLYAVLATVVAQRSREIALRVALGASRVAVLREVTADAAVIVLGGTAVGAFLSMWASQLVDPLIFDQYRVDALTLVVAEAVVVLVSVVACWYPARRALSASPADVLRAL